jgi:hypothetical protein
MNTSEQITADKALLESLGGAVAVCGKLGLEKSPGNVSRVSNWMTRGIPSKVKVERPDLFMRHAQSGAPP